MRRDVLLWIYLLGASCALLAEPARAFEATDRWNNTATNGFTGAEGSPITLTWSLPDDGTSLDTGTNDLIAMLDVEFGTAPGNDYRDRPWFGLFEDSFTRLSELAGVDYVYEPADDGLGFSISRPGVVGVRGDVRIGGRSYENNSTTLASNYFPDYGEMIFNTDKGSSFDNPANDFRFLRNTIMHEALHGLGLEHVEADTAAILLEPRISTAFDGPQLDDLLGMHRLYGDVYEKNGGNNAYTDATFLGIVGDSQPALKGLDGNSPEVATSQSDFLSIDDNSDTDFFSFTLQDPLDIAIDVTPKGAVYEVGPQGGSQAPLDTFRLSDLSLTLYNSNGSTVLGNANSAGIGEAEMLLTSLAPGTYYTRVNGSQDNVQLYQISIAATDSPESLTWIGGQSNVWDIGSTANFHDGTGSETFANRDTVVFDNAGLEQSISLSGSVTPAAIVFEGSSDYQLEGFGSISGGSVTVNGSGTVELANSGNTYTGPTQVNTGATLIFSGDTSAMSSAITIASGGTLIMDSAPAGANSSSFLVEPGGTLQIGREGSEADVFPNSPVSVVNFGVIRIVDFESVANVSGSGMVLASQETALLEKNSYTGQTRIESGGTLQPLDSTALGTAAGNTVVENGGTLLLQNDDFGPASLSLAEDILFEGSGNGGGALQVSGTLATFQGAWTVAEAGTHFSVSGDSQMDHTGPLNTLGQLVLEVWPSSSIHFAGTANLESGVLQIGAGTTEFSETAQFNGPVEIQEGTLRLTGDANVNNSVHVFEGGSLELNRDVTWHASSSLTGGGLVQGDLVMPGTMNPGDAGVGDMFIDGDLMLSDTSEMVVEIGGPGTGEFDLIDISGWSLLDGSLSVELIDLGQGIYQPQEGDRFSFLFLQQGRGGMFDTLNLPPLEAGLDWQLNFSTITADLEIVSVDTPDANLDGAIDGLDFLAFQRDDPSMIPLWQSSYGSGMPPQQLTVPEPAPAWLSALALVGCFVSRWRRAAVLGSSADCTAC